MNTHTQNLSDHLLPFFDQKNLFFFLIAPPAWGKTRLILDLLKKRKGHFIFVSPLRALANEFYEATQKVYPNFCLTPGNNIKETLEDFSRLPNALLIVTPEQCSENLIEHISNISRKGLLIFDEFHLFSYWGESFRPRMREAFIDLCSLEWPSLGLTATMDKNMLHRWEQELALQFEHLYALDVGNQTLINIPQKIHLFPRFLFKNALRRRFERELSKRKGTFLYFCRYRNQVDVAVRYYRARGLSVIGCKGGEVALFCDELKRTPNPDCIFATSALSHGVNLPAIEKIFFDGEIKNLDFWIQMVGRGGRKGESYEVFTYDDFSPRSDMLLEKKCWRLMKTIALDLCLFFYHW